MALILKTIRKYWIIICAVILLGFLILPSIKSTPLSDWDECVYAQYGKEMKQSGHILTYRWNNLKVFEKPPLYGWLMQAPYLFGVNEFTARILSFIAGMTILILVFLYSRNHLSQFGAILSLLILLQSRLFISSFTVVNTDIIEAVFVFAGFYLWMTSSKRFLNIYLAGLMFGLAILAKGLVAGIFPLAFLISSILTLEKKRIINCVRMCSFILIIILPWHIYEIARHGNDFIKVYFIDNLFIRSAIGIFGSRPIYYYFTIIARDSLPWLFLLGIYLIIVVKELKKRVFRSPIFNWIRKKDQFVIILSLCISLLILSVIKTRLRIYLIPIYPFYAISLAILGEELFSLLKRNNTTVMFSVLVMLVILKSSIPDFNFNYNGDGFAETEKIFYVLKEQQINEVDYLVPPEWRAHSQDGSTIPAQLFYGDVPCMVYYAEKKVNLYYDINLFKKRIFRGVKDLLIINNKDSNVIHGLPIKIVDKNTQYTIFTN